MVRLFRIFIPVSVVILLMSEVLLITAAFVVAAWLNPEMDPVTYLLYGRGPLNIALVGIYGWRIFFSSYVLKIMGGERLLLVGSSPVLADVAAHVQKHPEKGVRLIGFIHDDPDDPGAPPGTKFLGRLEALREIVD